MKLQHTKQPSISELILEILLVILIFGKNKIKGTVGKSNKSRNGTGGNPLIRYTLASNVRRYTAFEDGGSTCNGYLQIDRYILREHCNFSKSSKLMAILAYCGNEFHVNCIS